MKLQFVNLPDELKMAQKKYVRIWALKKAELKST